MLSHLYLLEMVEQYFEVFTLHALILYRFASIK